jgi:hypothetical protein
MTTTADKIRKVIAEAREDLDFPEEVREAVRSLEGRKIDKRFYNAVVRALGDRLESHMYSNLGGAKRMELTPVDGTCHRFLMGWDNDRDFNLTEFIDQNSPYFSGARQREDQRDARTDEDIEVLAAKIDAFKEARAALKADLEKHGRWADYIDIEAQVIGETL